MAGVMLMIVLATGMVLTSPNAEARVPWRISYAHPCDLSRDGVRNGSLETLCNRVWDQPAFEVRIGGGTYETPAGPTVVTELINETRNEFGNLTSRGAQTYLRTGLQNVRDDYARRVR